MELIDIIGISWFICGIIGFILMCVYDMRGQELDLNYFKQEYSISASLLVISLGALGIIIIIMENLKFIRKPKSHWFVKLLHKISNIGVKNNENPS